MEQTVFHGEATADIIISSTDTTGAVYTLTKPSWGGLSVPTNAIIRNAWIFFSNTYQYSATRLAKVVSVDFNGEDICAPFTTDGSAAGGNVETGFQVYLYKDKKYYQVVTQIRIRVRGGGGAAGNVFRILNGCSIDIQIDWDPGVQPWHKSGGVWHRHMFWQKYIGVWYRTMTRQKTGGIWR